MRLDQANGASSTGSPRRVGFALVALGVVVASLSWWRWERPREIVDRVPLPQFARLTNAVDVEVPESAAERRRSCWFRVLTPGDADDEFAAYAVRLEANGWDRRGELGERAVGRFRLGRRLLTLRARDAPEPRGWTAMRVTIEPCWPGSRQDDS